MFPSEFLDDLENTDEEPEDTDAVDGGGNTPTFCNNSFENFFLFCLENWPWWIATSNAALFLSDSLDELEDTDADDFLDENFHPCYSTKF